LIAGVALMMTSLLSHRIWSLNLQQDFTTLVAIITPLKAHRDHNRRFDYLRLSSLIERGFGVMLI
jgi:hypothetical protein